MPGRLDMCATNGDASVIAYFYIGCPGAQGFVFWGIHALAGIWKVQVPTSHALCSHLNIVIRRFPLEVLSGTVYLSL